MYFAQKIAFFLIFLRYAFFQDFRKTIAKED